MENEDSLQQYHQQFFQQQAKAFQELLKTLDVLLAIDSDIFPYLPELNMPCTQAFWKYQSQFQTAIKGSVKTELIAKVASSFYRTLNGHLNQTPKNSNQLTIFEQMQYQYQKCLGKLSKTPPILKICQHFLQLRRLLKETHNIHATFERIQEIKKIIQQEYLPDDDYDIVFVWKLRSCERIILKAKNKDKSKNIDNYKSHASLVPGRNLVKRGDKANKSDFVTYIKQSKLLLKNEKISPKTLYTTYKLLLYYSLKHEDQHTTYLQLEIQSLKKNYKFDNSQEKEIKVLLDKSYVLTKEKLANFMEKKWVQEQNEHLSRTARQGKCRNLFLKQTNALIFRFQPIKRRLVTEKQPNAVSNVKTIAFSQYTSSKKRIGFISQKKSSISKRLVDQKKNESVYSAASYRRKLKTSVYKCIQDMTIKEPIVTVAALQCEMENLKSRTVQLPIVTHDQILLDFSKKKMLKNRSVKMSKFDSSDHGEYGILDNFVLHYLEIFGQERYEVKLFEEEDEEENVIGFGFEIKHSSTPPHRIVFQNDKTIVLFQNFRKIIQSSQFYFELMQQKLEQQMDNAEFGLLQNLLSQEGKFTDNGETAFLLSTIKYFRSYLYWYYTIESKITGCVLAKRVNTKISDSLKFCIALDFLRKNDVQTCLRDFPNVRNKTGLLECFNYLSQGREILAKCLVSYDLEKYYCVFSVDKRHYRSFRIHQKTQLPYFKGAVFKKTLYNLKSWKVEKELTLESENHFSQQQQTLIMLENIIDNLISKKNLKRFLLSAQNDESEFLLSRDKKIKYNLVVAEDSDSQEDEDKLFKLNIKKNLNRVIQSGLSQFLPALTNLSQIYEQSFNFKISTQITEIVSISGAYYRRKQSIFEGKTSITQFECCRNQLKNILYRPCQKSYSQSLQSANRCDFVMIESPFFNRIGIVNSLTQRLVEVNQIRKSVQQKHIKNNLRVIIKQVVRKAGKFMYCGLIENLQLEGCFRIDIYFPHSQKNFFSLFTLQQAEKAILNFARIKDLMNGIKQVRMTTNSSNQNLSYAQKGKYLKLREKEIQAWKFLLRSSFDPNISTNTLSIFDLKVTLFETFCAVQFFSKSVCGKLELVEIESKNKIYYLIHDYEKRGDGEGRSSIRFSLRFHNSKLFIGQVDENPFSYNVNIFSDCISKDFKVNLYTDLFVRLYVRFVNSQLPMRDVSLNQVSDPFYFLN